MNIILAILGACIGGTLWHFGGAITGGIIGWLCGRIAELGTQQRVFRDELQRLRERLADYSPLPQPAPQPPPEEKPLPQLDTLELSLRDMVLEPVSPPVAETLHKPQGEPCRPHRQTERRTQEPLAPAPPSPFAEWLADLFTAENLLVKVGVVILFIGVSFLVKYAALRGLFPLELRLTAAASGGCTLLAVGWRLRKERPVYAQVIQGGGVGILYLTTYAAMRLYHLIPVIAGFGILVIVCALAGYLAVAQNSRSMAVLGSVGGFLAPELASLGSGSHVTLFAYYTVLNLGVLAIARYRCWRELNLVGFVGTFIVGAFWGWRFYQPAHFFSVEPFLLVFFLIYSLLPVLYARNDTTELEGFVDVGLVFGTPIIVFAYQHALVQRFEYGLAWSSLFLGMYYLVLAGRLLRSEPERLRNLAEAFLDLGVLFATLTIPLALDGRWTAAAWSVEGAALIRAGLRQRRLLARLAGYLLILGSGIAFAATMGMKTGPWPVLNSFYVGCLLQTAAGLCCARLLAREQKLLPEHERLMETVLFVWGMTWWFGGGLQEIALHTVASQRPGARLLFVALSSLACELLHRRLAWRLLSLPPLGLLPVMGFFALMQLCGSSRYPSLHGGWYGWPLSLAVWYLTVFRREGEGNRLHPVAHAAPLWLLTLLIGWELSGRLLHQLPGMTTWAICIQGAVPALVLLLVSRYGERLAWPLARHRPDYLGWGTLPLAGYALFWLLRTNMTLSASPWPLPYLPLVNPLDGVTLLVLVSLAAWYRELPLVLPELAENLPQRELRIVGCAIIFFWFNTILLRTVHHWCGVPYNFQDLFASLIVQTTITIFWCLLAMGAMTLATHRGVREIWLAGAGLLGAVVIKLFMVDLAGHGSVARIVSFVVVGLLMLLIGWFSPVPPRMAKGGKS
jgi:uncharacterized membrane protein